jgi:hypothetical protein
MHNVLPCVPKELGYGKKDDRYFSLIVNNLCTHDKYSKF